jgi:hypothetical protein
MELMNNDVAEDALWLKSSALQNAMESDAIVTLTKMRSHRSPMKIRSCDLAII